MCVTCFFLCRSLCGNIQVDGLRTHLFISNFRISHFDCWDSYFDCLDFIFQLLVFHISIVSISYFDC